MSLVAGHPRQRGGVVHQDVDVGGVGGVGGVGWVEDGGGVGNSGWTAEQAAPRRANGGPQPTPESRVLGRVDPGHGSVPVMVRGLSAAPGKLGARKDGPRRAQLLAVPGSDSPCQSGVTTGSLC
jgi:hypothetical protein